MSFSELVELLASGFTAYCYGGDEWSSGWPLPQTEALGDISRCSKDVALPWPQDHVDDDGDQPSE